MGEPAVGKLREPILRQRRTGAITAQVREALAVVGVQVHSAMEGKALEVSGLLLDLHRLRKVARGSKRRRSIPGGIIVGAEFGSPADTARSASPAGPDRVEMAAPAPYLRRSTSERLK